MASDLLCLFLRHINNNVPYISVWLQNTRKLTLWFVQKNCQTISRWRHVNLWSTCRRLSGNSTRGSLTEECLCTAAAARIWESGTRFPSRIQHSPLAGIISVLTLHCYCRIKQLTFREIVLMREYCEGPTTTTTSRRTKKKYANPPPLAENIHFIVSRETTVTTACRGPVPQNVFLLSNFSVA